MGGIGVFVGVLEGVGDKVLVGTGEMVGVGGISVLVDVGGIGVLVDVGVIGVLVAVGGIGVMVGVLVGVAVARRVRGYKFTFGTNCLVSIPGASHSR